MVNDLEGWLEGAFSEGLWSTGRSVLFLTGAGISAESGIPTFRGPDGYWQVGSRNYRPEELATREAFDRMPREVWAWYLYRRAVCLRAEPNAAHRALAELDTLLGPRCLLVTQNVDGLHLRAGHSPQRTYEIHGNINAMRCLAPTHECRPEPIPADVPHEWGKTQALTASQFAALRCTTCGGLSRPHVLWFDECYDEVTFRFESSLRAVREASLLVVIGTSGQTTLPFEMGRLAATEGIPICVINREPNPFVRLGGENVHFAQGAAGTLVPALVRILTALQE